MKDCICGLIYTDGKMFLVVHKKNENKWDIPQSMYNSNTDHDELHTAMKAFARDTGLYLDYHGAKISLMKSGDSESFKLVQYKEAHLVYTQKFGLFNEPDKNINQYKYVDLVEAKSILDPDVVSILELNLS